MMPLGGSCGFSVSCRASPGTAPAFGLLDGASESSERFIHDARKSSSRQNAWKLLVLVLVLVLLLFLR